MKAKHFKLILSVLAFLSISINMVQNIVSLFV